VWDELVICSNVVRNTLGVLMVEGKRQISLERGDSDYQLLLTMDIYESNGAHVAKLRRNAWAFNDNDRFDITTNPQSLRLVDKQSSNTVVEAQVLSRDKVQVPTGAFFTATGVPIEITPEYLRIGNLSMAGSRIDGFGNAITINGGGIGIGSP
jgi:hypothetical protein